MPKNSAHAQFVQEIKDLKTSTAAIADHLKVLSSSFSTVLSTSTESTQQLLEASALLSSGFNTSTTTLSDCLADLVSMGEAMTPVMESSPEASPALVVNLYTTFFRQLKAYIRDTNDCFGRCDNLFEQGRAAFYKEKFTASTAAVAGGARSNPTTPAPTVGEAGEPGRDGAAPSASTPPPPAPDAAGDAAPREKHKKKKKKAVLEDEGVGGTAETTPAPLASPAAATPTTDLPREFGSAAAQEDPEVAALSAAAAVGGPQKTRRAKTKKALEEQPDAAAAALPSAYSPPVNEPAYLIATGSVEDAMGRVMLASRPNVFSSVELFFRNPPTSTYYIRLQRPGSLALFVVRNYVNVNEDTQADLFCDVLDTDTVEVEPTSSPAGEVLVSDEGDLSQLPACAWRIGNNEDQSRLLYTMYILVSQPTMLGRSAIVQDSLTIDEQREEVAHVVTLVENAPQFAKVSAFAMDARGAGGGPKTAAILSFSRASFAQTGFPEVTEAEVVAAVATKKQDSSELMRELRSVSTASVDAKQAFQPPVQLASLDRPAKTGWPTLTMSDVARTAMRGSMEVLKAPLTVGRSVGGAVMDATGASDAIRKNLEENFHKFFPKLANETIVDTFSCGWLQGALPKQGYLLVNTHSLCFLGSVANAQFALDYDEIKDVKKSKSLKVVDTSIEVTTHVGDKIALVGFVDRDKAYSTLMQRWVN